jgi:spore maturation protein CgeB
MCQLYRTAEVENDASPVSPGAILLVGNPAAEHVGNHLLCAAQSLEIPVQLCSSDLAFRANPLLEKFNWWFRSHRPARLGEFSRDVVKSFIQADARYLLSTGIAPLDADALDAAGRAGITRMNFLTDDPWNPQHRAEWFMRALPKYDIVFSPRRANLEDLRQAGCRNVRYLPFAYAPELHFPDPPVTPVDQAQYDADVVFAGGADPERAPYFSALIEAGVKVALYGGYWRRYSGTRSADRGFASPEGLRKAIGGGRVAICLVRRANRDGHAMRTYELAATGACILAEDTPEHREILGADGVSAVYFRSLSEMIVKAQDLLRDQPRRQRLSAEVRARICGGGNTYRDRLETMLRLAGATQSEAVD